MNVVLVAAVVALVAATAALGTCVALRTIAAEMPAELNRMARLCAIALGTGLGSGLILAVLVQSAGLDTPRTVALELLIAATLAGMVAEHAAASRWLRLRWLCTPGASLPPLTAPRRWPRRLQPQVALAGASGLLAAVLIAAALSDPTLPRWTLLFGLASAGQGVGVALTAARPLRRPAG
ncbi:MAG TPA: hypothetical protein VGL20_12560 [Candidatus Dormibacteraeota bacterium]